MAAHNYQSIGKKKILVCVVVHNRPTNIMRWLTAWNACVKYMDAKLAIIHNWNPPLSNKLNQQMQQAILMSGLPAPDVMLSRPNLGYDIGAFQDMCTDQMLVSYPNLLAWPDSSKREEVLDVLRNWDILHWAVDDSIPMSKNFLPDFVQKLCQPTVGIVGAQISTERNYHVRTNFFSIKREVARRLMFPVERVTTKEDCWDFEHGLLIPGHSMTYQVTRLSYLATVPGYHSSKPEQHMLNYAWDINHHAKLNLWAKFWAEFPACKAFGTQQ